MGQIKSCGLNSAELGWRSIENYIAIFQFGSSCCRRLLETTLYSNALCARGFPSTTSLLLQLIKEQFEWVFAWLWWAQFLKEQSSKGRRSGRSLPDWTVKWSENSTFDLKSHIQKPFYSGGAWTQLAFSLKEPKMSAWNPSWKDLHAWADVIMWRNFVRNHRNWKSIHLLSLSFISVRKHPPLLSLDACSFSTCTVLDAVSTDPPGKSYLASAWCCPHQLGTDAHLALTLPTPLDAWCFLGSRAATSKVPSSEQQCFQITKSNYCHP